MNEDHELPVMLDALREWIGDEPQGVRRRTAMVPIGTQVEFPQRSDGRRGWPVFIVGDAYCLPGIPRLVAILLPLLPNGPGPRPAAKIRFQGYETQGARAMECVAANFPQLAFGSYPPTQMESRWVSLTIRGENKQTVEEATQSLLDELAADQLTAERV